GGDWNTGSNWSTGTPPDNGDDVVINQVGLTITHSMGTHSVGNVTSSSNLTLSGGTLSGSGNFQFSSDAIFTLQGGTLRDATAFVNAGASKLLLTNSNNVLDGVTVNGDMDLSQQFATVHIHGGLVLDGTMFLGDAAGNTFGRVFVTHSNGVPGSITKSPTGT